MRRIFSMTGVLGILLSSVIFYPATIGHISLDRLKPDPGNRNTSGTNDLTGDPLSGVFVLSCNRFDSFYLNLQTSHEIFSSRKRDHAMM